MIIWGTVCLLTQLQLCQIRKLHPLKENEAVPATGIEIENEIINKPNQPRRGKFPSKNLANSSVVLILKGTSIQVQLNKQVGLEQKKNLHCLEIIFSSIEYLARQGLLLRGHEAQRGIFISSLNYGQMTAKFGWNIKELVKFKMKY